MKLKDEYKIGDQLLVRDNNSVGTVLSVGARTITIKMRFSTFKTTYHKNPNYNEVLERFRKI